MPLWEKEIKALAMDFNIPKQTIDNLLKQVKIKCSTREIPNYYKGNVNEYLYDNAQRQMVKLLYA